MVPRSLHEPDLNPDLVFRSAAAGLSLIAILMARRIWKIRNPLAARDPWTPVQFVLVFIWFELIIAFIGVLGIIRAMLFPR